MEVAQKPTFYSDSDFFIVTLPNRSVATPAQISMESVESNAESAETCHRKVATSTLKVASDIYKTPLYRTAHSPENYSDEWAFFFLYIKYTFVVTQIATKSWIKNHLFLFSGALHTFAHRREVQILSTCPKYALKSLLDAILKSIYNWVRNQL